jgi:hypothetical protein
VGLQLPSELCTLLSTLGQKYPEADETKLIEMGRSFIKFGDKVGTIIADAKAKASTVWADGESSDIAAFKKWWTDQDSPVAVLEDICKAMVVAGTGMMIVGGIILLLKIGIIHQLVILAMQIAQAIAKAPATWGASLAEIPIYQQISRKLIDRLVEEVATKLING